VFGTAIVVVSAGALGTLAGAESDCALQSSLRRLRSHVVAAPSALLCLGDLFPEEIVTTVAPFRADRNMKRRRLRGVPEIWIGFIQELDAGMLVSSNKHLRGRGSNASYHRPVRQRLAQGHASCHDLDKHPNGKRMNGNFHNTIGFQVLPAKTFCIYALESCRFHVRRVLKNLGN
jgi:hypothetical protein